MSDLWSAASIDYEGESKERLIATARIACAPQFGFVAEAQSLPEFEDRLSLVAGEVEGIINRLAVSDPGLFPVVHAAVLESWNEDFDLLLESRRTAALTCPVCGKNGGLALLDGKPCMECIRSRQRAAMDGRCHCGRNRIEGDEKSVGSRRWIPCERCLGTIRQTAALHTAPGGGIHAPYDVKKRGDKWVVVNSLGEVKGTHPTEQAARQQQKALYRNVPGAREKAASRKVANHPDDYSDEPLDYLEESFVLGFEAGKSAYAAGQPRMVPAESPFYDMGGDGGRRTEWARGWLNGWDHANIDDVDPSFYWASRRTAVAQMCEQCHVKPATQYVMGPYAGDWGGRYCDDCADKVASPGSVREKLRNNASRRTAATIQDMYASDDEYDPDDTAICNACDESFMLGDADRDGAEFVCPYCGSEDMYVMALSQSDYADRMAERQQLGLTGSRKTAATMNDLKNMTARIPANVGSRDFDPQVLLQQIGRMNVLAISGGRASVITVKNRPVGVYLPVGAGYGVNVFLADDDTYTVQRVVRGNVKGEQTGVYMDEVGEAAYQASSFRSNDFGGHRVGSRKTAYVQNDDDRTRLGTALSSLFDAVTNLYFRAHLAHWNVVGPDFAQYHALFSEIYEDVYGSLDPIAESLRKIGLPVNMGDVVVSMQTESDALQLASLLYSRNVIVLQLLEDTLNIADGLGEQGIVNFLGGRIEQHQKWGWFLQSAITPQRTASRRTAAYDEDGNGPALFGGNPGPVNDFSLTYTENPDFYDPPSDSNIGWVDDEGMGDLKYELSKDAARGWPQKTIDAWNEIQNKGHSATTPRERRVVDEMDTADRDDYYFLRGLGMTHQQAVKKLRSQTTGESNIWEEWINKTLRVASLHGRHQLSKGAAQEIPEGFFDAWDDIEDAGWDMANEQEKEESKQLHPDLQDEYFFLRGFGMTHQQAMQKMLSITPGQSPIWDEFVNKTLRVGSLRRRAADENPCWDGYEMIGMKKKDGKMVPNCVPSKKAAALRRLADQGFGPDQNSQSGHAESQVDWVDVDATDNSNLGWIDYEGDDLPEAYDESDDGQVGPFGASRRQANIFERAEKSWRKENACPECEGSGTIDDFDRGWRSCPACNGTGFKNGVVRKNWSEASRRTAAGDLFAAADAAYSRRDQSWFDALSMDDLLTLWNAVSGENFMSGSMTYAWDDEVFEALADKGYFSSTASRRRTAGENPFAKKDDGKGDTKKDEPKKDESKAPKSDAAGDAGGTAKTPPPAAEQGDPATMNPGDKSQMTYTMADGNNGTLEVVFVRENNGVYFFNGPTGEFGVANQSGVWKDADGNSFQFASDGKDDASAVQPKEEVKPAQQEMPEEEPEDEAEKEPKKAVRRGPNRR